MNLTNTITNLCECLEKNQSKWCVKHYSKNFEDLWSNQPKLKNNILIVWDGFPEKEESDNSLVNFERYLTPIDWALAYSRYWFEENKENKNGDQQLRIVIVDVYSHSYSQNLNFHCRHVLPNMDWVKFYSFNNMDFSKVLSPLGLTDLPTNSEGWDYKKAKQKMEDLSNLWQQSLAASATKENSHHSINNILGPMLLERTLSEDLQKEIRDKSSLQSAFRQCLEWHSMGLKPNEPDNRSKCKLHESLDGAKLVLIDDQAQNWINVIYGWVYGALPEQQEIKTNQWNSVGPEKESIQVSISPNLVIETLESVNKDDKNQRFRLHFTGEDSQGDDQRNEILLFDLYLFSDSNDEENKYFREIFEVAESYCKENNSISEKLDLSSLKNENNKNYYSSFLTLLPRLIAQIDPSIPIIIFSSTGQRSIIDKFNDYANIITCFEKPRVLGYRSDDAGLIRHNFETAIKQAMQFIKVRQRLRSIIS